MTHPKAILVFTSISDPVALEDYHRNFAAHGRLDQVEAIMIPDRKTPAAAYERCAALTKKGFRVTCPAPQEQEAFLQKAGLLPDMIPWNTDNRRNVGFLMAIERGMDFLISIDDDNHCREGEDFFAAHAVVCNGPQKHPVVETASGWFNLCSLLTFDRPGTTWPRGFPYFARQRGPDVETSLPEAGLQITETEVDVHVNAGLWLLDPDVDGISWLVNPMHSTGFKGTSLVLGQKVWSPVNTQNTALRAAAAGAYYYIRMGTPLGGFAIDRYGDIFSGYFLQACAKHLGGLVRAGTPVADHRRNSHNYLKDATQEWGGLLALEDLLRWLPEAKLEGSNYLDAYQSLAAALDEAVERFQGPFWHDAARAWFHQTTDCMRTWVGCCRRLSGRP